MRRFSISKADLAVGILLIVGAVALGAVGALLIGRFVF